MSVFSKLNRFLVVPDAMLDISHYSETVKASFLAGSKASKIPCLGWMPIVGQLNGFLDVRDTVLKVSQLAETSKENLLAVAEV
jgi:hypothetical protein